MKTVLIIGSTGTIGKNLVSYYKDENCIEASRSLENQGNFYHLDLSNFQSVLEFLEKMKDQTVDLLYLNSGVYTKDKKFVDGYEYHFMVNAFGPYYFTKLFCKTHPNCKIILTSSVSILHAKPNLQPKKQKHIYRNTKLLEYLLVRELEKIYPTQAFLYAHPGILCSKLSLSLHSSWVGKLIQWFGNTEERALACLIYASKLKDCKDRWVCPNGLFGLRGKPSVKKIKKNLKLNDEFKKKIQKIEKEIEEKYGI